MNDSDYLIPVYNFGDACIGFFGFVFIYFRMMPPYF